jgi:hypothetical protein
MRAIKRHEFNVGQPVKLSALGCERVRTINPDHCGVVIGLSLSGNACRIQFPGRKSAMTLHISYIEKSESEFDQVG